MRIKVIFLFILLLAVLLRLWGLGSTPPSPDWDEAALGYNAYSIYHTGKDEYGEFLPVVLRSFDDYKPALYAYLTIPSILLFGVNTFAVRFVSALFGILTVAVTYFFVKELFGKYGITLNGKQLKPEYLGLLAAFLLAISPWHIQFSRIAFESNVGVAFNLFAAYFFLLGLRRPLFFSVSALCMALNLYVYQSEKVFTPLLFLVLLAATFKDVFKVPKKYLALACIVGVLVTLPMAHYLLTNKESLARAQGVSVFADSTVFLRDNVERLSNDKERGDVVGLVFNNRRVEYVKSIVAGYLAHYDPNWLFITGDIVRHHAPDMGLMYPWELPFLLVGVYHLLFTKIDRRVKILLLGWIIITPIPASVTSGVPHAVRTLNFLPILQITTAVGIFAAWHLLLQKRKVFRYIPHIAASIFFVVFSFTFLYYLNQYFVQQNILNSYDWQYGYEKAVSQIRRLEPNYEKIIVSNQPPLDQSYMFFLFYLLYPPEQYHEDAMYASGGFRENHAFGKYEFRPIDWENEEKGERILFVGRPGDFPDGISSLSTINYLNGSPAIMIITAE